LRGASVGFGRTRCVPDASSEASTTRRRLRLPRWCFGERVRLFPCPLQRRGWPAVPAAGAGGTTGTPHAPGTPHGEPTPTASPRGVEHRSAHAQATPAIAPRQRVQLSIVSSCK
jgi:hypothetical protein